MYKNNFFVHFLFLIIHLVSCSKFQITRNRITGEWKLEKFEILKIDSKGNLSLELSESENLGRFIVKKSFEEKNIFEYKSDVFNAPSGVFYLSRNGRKIQFLPSELVYYVSNIEKKRMILIHHNNNLFDGHIRESRFYFSK